MSDSEISSPTRLLTRKTLRAQSTQRWLCHRPSLLGLFGAAGAALYRRGARTRRGIDQRMIVALALIAVFVVPGCATYEETLTNSHGQTETCKASGKNGIFTGQYLRESFDNCINQAKAAGYTETPVKPGQ
jgi:hypothetical protein